MAKGSIAALLLLLAATSVSAQRASDLWTYARSNAGLFVSEQRHPASTVTVRVQASFSDLGWPDYDDTRGVAASNIPRRLDSKVLEVACRDIGARKAKTTFGKTVTIKNRFCEVLVIDDTAGGLKLSTEACEGEQSAACPVHLRADKIEVPMSPQQFRGLKADGGYFDLIFDVGQGVTKELVEVEAREEEATLNTLAETSTKRYRVRGQVRAATLIAADGRTSLFEFKR